MFTIGSIAEMTGVIAVGGAVLVAVMAIVFGAVRRVHFVKHREHSRREIAAYVAEGTMTAEEGAKLMDAGLPVWERVPVHSGGSR